MERFDVLLFCVLGICSVPGALCQVVSTLAGSGTTGAYADGTGTVASFKIPYGISYDSSSGALFVTDSSNNRIRVIHMPSSANIIGDPEFQGFFRQHYDLCMAPNRVYNLLSSPNLFVNAQFSSSVADTIEDECVISHMGLVLHAGNDCIVKVSLEPPLMSGVDLQCGLPGTPQAGVFVNETHVAVRQVLIHFDHNGSLRIVAPQHELLLEYVQQNVLLPSGDRHMYFNVHVERWDVHQQQCVRGLLGETVHSWATDIYIPECVLENGRLNPWCFLEGQPEDYRLVDDDLVSTSCPMCSICSP